MSKKKKKKRVPPKMTLASRRALRWALLSKEPDQVVEQETLLLILNAIWMARNRGQKIALAVVMLERGWKPIKDNQNAKRAFRAFNLAEEKVEALGFSVNPNYIQELHSVEGQVAYLLAEITNIQIGDFGRLKNLHWATRELSREFKKIRKSTVHVPRLRKKE